MSTITPLPDPPDRRDPINFASRADAFLAAMRVMVDEFNVAAFGSAAELGSYLADPTNPSNGAGRVAWDFNNNYVVDTIGWAQKQGALNVVWFGADPSGTADSTSAIQGVVNLALTLKRSVYIPGGTYLLNGAASSDSFKNGILVPFSAINFDFNDGLLIYGDQGRTTLLAGSNDMIIVRIARNCVTLQDITVRGNGKTNVWGYGIVPESVTQTTTTVSQSFITMRSCVAESCHEGWVIQPGPHVSGSDSGCFYHKFFACIGNLNTRHVYLKKGSTWATDVNRPTRTSFYGCHLLRGNTGWHFEVGSEIELHGCTEELISSGTSPNATPVARYVSADCLNINFFGGYSEACTKSFTGFASGIVNSWGYVPASGSNLDYRAYVSSWADLTDDDAAWTPVLQSSGGGTQGASTSTGFLSKSGKIVTFSAQVSASKGTLAAGTLSVAGLPFIADAGWTGASFQHIPVPLWSGMTFTANITSLAALISGTTMTIRKMHAAGAGPASLTLAECSDPVVFTVQGSYKAT